MFNKPLTYADYPLTVTGSSVYRKTESSPLITAGSPELAADLCNRLNSSLRMDKRIHELNMATNLRDNLALQALTGSRARSRPRIHIVRGH